MSDKKLHFIVVDDSKLDCFIAEKIIRNTGRCETVHTFQHAADALDYIKGLPQHHEGTVLFIDIQMPVMNGFEFVEAFETLPPETKSFYTIYMLSSSINENDITKVKGYPSVKQFLNKPLTGKTMSVLMETY